MRKFRIYQIMFLGTVEVPDSAFDRDTDFMEEDVIAHMDLNDCWPEDYLEPIETIIEEDIEL